MVSRSAIAFHLTFAATIVISSCLHLRALDKAKTARSLGLRVPSSHRAMVTLLTPIISASSLCVSFLPWRSSAIVMYPRLAQILYQRKRIAALHFLDAAALCDAAIRYNKNATVRRPLVSAKSNLHAALFCWVLCSVSLETRDAVILNRLFIGLCGVGENFAILEVGMHSYNIEADRTI